MNRDYSVDIAKGFGIFFVIGHCHIPIEKEIFVFHLPVFFFIAGFFFKMESYKTDTIILMVISLPLGIWIMKKCPTLFSYK